jgi:MFS family permease
MFGAIIYLPQYLQIVRGESPTASGLLTLPLMLGLLSSSIMSGRWITRTGRYKRYPVVGLLVTAAGLALLSLLQVGTSLVVAGGFMLVTGVGIGLVMQVLVLATQNSVDRSDLGVATSGATFFRSMGGALGVAVFGALLSHELRQNIPDRLAAAGVPAPAGGRVTKLGSPSDIAALPGRIHDAVVGAFADGLDMVFLAAVPFAVIGFLLVLFLRETPLRQRDEPRREDAPLAAALEPAVDPA